jgi:hypothetical protein
MVAKFTRKDFLEALFSDYYKEHRGFILVKSLRRGDPKMSTRYFPNIEILSKEHYGDERDVYFGIAPRERMKAEKEHIHYVVALWADLDIGKEGHEDKNLYFEGPQQAARAIRSFPRAPSLIVESGRGAHLYWLLKNVTQVEDADFVESLLKSISDHLRCETDVSVDCVFRLPETVNTKVPGKPVACDVKFINTNFRYDIGDFENLGQPIVVQPTASATPPAPGGAADGVPSPPAAGLPPPDPAGPNPEQLDESLVLDETIIDELIDDMSMTNVLDPITTGEIAAGLSRTPSQEPVTIPSPTSPQGVSTSQVVATQPVAAAFPAATSSVLERLVANREEVQLSLVGSSELISGVIASNENGLIGIESGGDLYTVPISSISYIKSKA